ncbi:MAG: hypothetical protein PHR28_06560 [candidate division Zixibacteria bacterium]|nr:hypothetical protein [candidate division Zixibacteria bacterium]
MQFGKAHRPPLTGAGRTCHRPGQWLWRTLIIGILAMPVVLSSPAEALFSNNLNGYIRVTGVSSSVDTVTSRSLSQEYSAYWSKRMAAYFEMRASMRYLNLGLDQNLGENSWRREYQPAGELLWAHPDFTIGGLVKRRKTTNNATDGALIDDNVAVTLSTRMTGYPILRARYDWEHAYSDGQSFERDTRQNNVQIGLTYNLRRQSFYYSFSHRRQNDDRGGLQITENQHLFRWNQTTMFPGQFLRVSSTYDFGRRAQETETTADSTVLSAIPFRLALYAYDPTPEFGTLDTLPSLADGNTSSPAQPQVNVGAGLADRNIGLDFGYNADIAALYIYTDRPSGPVMSWRVWLSSDNLTWTQLDQPVMVTFNAGFNRYELVFATVKTRYIKAVNSGANDESTVLVTEVEARERLQKSSLENRHQTTHMANVIGTVILSKKLESSAELSVRRQPKGEFTDSRNQLYYAFSLRHAPSTAVTQTVKYQAGYEDFSAGGIRNDNNNLTYSLAVTPLTTLHFSFVALNRMDYIQSVKTQETNNLSFKTTGNLLAGLTLSGETTYSRSNRYDSRRAFDTWTYRAGADGTLVRSLDFSASFLYQGTHQVNADFSYIRRQYAIDINWRLTQTIVGHGSLTFDNDAARRYTYQTYGLSWTVTPKIQLGAQATVTGGESDVTGDRNSAQITYQATSRSSLYFSASNIEYPAAGRARGTSFQLGLKTGF